MLCSLSECPWPGYLVFMPQIPAYFLRDVSDDSKPPFTTCHVTVISPCHALVTTGIW